ncbi:hypothetical protein RHSIM_Rhsim10G0071900 [Rhododendron simsii]|uniref:Transposase-associated domain-containing protein n=1 Tax=Rhododendron simsii TaxID=118357 RepID=A0A834GA41_RHOSS|nr:hypothetical protein RHSIM_Rhsim10G0071900 [Rhododendron simsii]
MDKDWMAMKNRWSEQYKQGVESFITFAVANSGTQAEIRCPYIDCLNSKTLSSEVFRIHLILKGINSSYEPVPARHPQTQYDDYHEHNEGIGNQIGREREDVRYFDKLFKLLNVKLILVVQRQFYHSLLRCFMLKKLGNETLDMIMKIIKEMLPVDHEIKSTITWTIYDAKKFLRDLGLGYIPIHACKYECSLFWEENANLENCPTCNEPRYKVNDGTGKKIPHKILRYLPLTPRLQRLYYCKKTAPDMRLHKYKHVDDEELRHPADGQEWKDFDEHFPDFASEPRNTIHDLPAYAIMFGWSTKGYLACLICNEDNSSVRLRSKIGYLGARRYLPEHHIWRRSKLFNGKFEDRTRSLELLGEEILQQINLGTCPPFGKHPNKSRKRKRDEYENNLNLSKKNILCELPCAPFLNLRYNLNPMHIGKNICDNLVGTSLGIDGKNKNMEKVRKDMEDQETRKELHLKRHANGTFEKPPSMYTLSPTEREGFCYFLKSIKYPDGYAANISKCVNTHGGNQKSRLPCPFATNSPDSI